MKFAALFFALAMFAVCERPPSPEPDHSKHDHSNASHASMNHSKMESSPRAAQAPPALQFIDTMIAHHQGAIEMALLAETRSQRAELKQLARIILSEQRREIAQLQAIRNKAFAGLEPAINMDYPGMRTGMNGMDTAKLDALKANEFDIEFVKQMIPHHEGALEMAKALTVEDGQAELKAFADKVIKDQSAEIATMKGWLSEWAEKGNNG